MMKKLLGLILIGVLIVSLTGCNMVRREQRYGEGDVVRVLINLAFDESTQHFVNLRIHNDSDEARLLRIEGFEYLEDGEWVLIPPIGEDDWLHDFIFDGDPLQIAGTDGDTFNTIMNFHDWLNPNYPTLGEFRASVRVYDLDGDYQFTQTSNSRELQYFRFE